MIRVRHIATLGVSLLTLACSPDPEQLEVAAALDRTITSLEAGDMAALWDITAPTAQREVLKLQKEVHTALAVIDQVYPPESREDARKAVGQRLMGDIELGDPEAGPKILRRILDPKAVRLDEKARDGLRSRNATIDGEKAQIHTSAGEKFTFEKTDAGWRSGLVMDLIEQSRRFDTLRENAEQVLAAQQAQREAWVASRNPKTPHGAYNLLRKTLSDKPPKAKVIYSLLDKATRAVALETLQAARKLQRMLQRRHKKARRRALYKKYGLSKYVKLDTDRKVFALWVSDSKFVGPVGQLGAKPASVEGAEASGLVTIVTDKNTRHRMRRGDDGIWRTADYAPVLREKLLSPLQESIKRLTAPKSKPNGSKKGG